MADGLDLPDRWSEGENIAWKVAIPGDGWSSPIVWGDRIYVTSAIVDGPYKEPTTGIFGNGTIAQLIKEGKSPQEAGQVVSHRDTEKPEEIGSIKRTLYCLDLETGALLWGREVHSGKPVAGRHRKNSYASATPVTNGDQVFAYFQNVGLFAFSADGEPLWEQRFEPHQVYLDFGGGASLAIDPQPRAMTNSSAGSASATPMTSQVYVQFDNEDVSFLAAFDQATGDEQWRRVRAEGPGNSGWSTPLVWRNSVRTEIVTLGVFHAISYDQAGNELWRLGGVSRITAPVPVPYRDDERELILLSAGSTSEQIRTLVAIRPGAKGDISLAKGETSNEFVAWYQPKGGTYIPTPVAYRGSLFALYDKGFFAAFDLDSGERTFMERVGSRNAFSASPWAYDGKIFALSEEGKTFVFEAADEYRLLHTNDLDQMTLASPALTTRGLILRTKSHLYRIANRGSATSPDSVPGGE